MIIADIFKKETEMGKKHCFLPIFDCTISTFSCSKKVYRCRPY